MENEFSEMMNRLSEDARFALQKADLFSKKYNNGYMGTEHILLVCWRKMRRRGRNSWRSLMWI